MYISNDSNIPIYMQIAYLIEENILDGTFKENSKIISTNDLSLELQVNPITVLKGMNVLVDEKILFKKRGLGIFVTENALSIIIKKRSEQFSEKYVDSVVNEAIKLNISEEELINFIKNKYRQKGGIK